MATIPCKRTLCSGGVCLIKEQCSRYEKNADCAPDYDGVAFFIRPPWDGGHCENFDPMKEKEDGSAGDVESQVYCCSEFAVANSQRQIVYSSDEDSGWVVKCDAFTDALLDIRHCPWCGDRLPTEET